jgi:hypothetical protein
MELNNRQAYFIADLANICLKGQEIYAETKRLLKSFTEEFESGQSNALNVVEGETIVNSDSSSGSKKLHVASTVGFVIGDSVVIDKGGSRHEVGVIDVVGTTDIDLVDSLLYDHLAVDADSVQGMGGIYLLGLDCTSIVIACEEFMTQFVNFWEGSAVATREYGKDARRVANNE